MYEGVFSDQSFLHTTAHPAATDGPASELSDFFPRSRKATDENRSNLLVVRIRGGRLTQRSGKRQKFIDNTERKDQRGKERQKESLYNLEFRSFFELENIGTAISRQEQNQK